MRYRKLGRSGLLVSELILGSAGVGEMVDEGEYLQTVRAAIDGGINTFDTADVYGGGQAEGALGRAVAGLRDRVNICTKVGQRVGDSAVERAATARGQIDVTERFRRGIGTNDQGLSRKHLIAAVEASLRRLGTDYIDLYQVHHWDPLTPIDETLATLDEIVRAGKVRYVGCSGFAGWQLCRALWRSEVGDWPRFESIQLPLSLIQAATSEALVSAKELEVSVLAWSVLAGGVLTGRYDKDVEPALGTRMASRPMYRGLFWTDKSFAAVDRLRGIGGASGRTPGQLALGWVLGNADRTSALIGCEHPSELRHLLEVVERPLSAEEWGAVDAVADRTPAKPTT